MLESAKLSIHSNTVKYSNLFRLALLHNPIGTFTCQQASNDNIVVQSRYTLNLDQLHLVSSLISSRFFSIQNKHRLLHSQVDPFTVMPEDSALEALSPELQQKILLHLESLDTLYALIRASPRLLQVFRLNREKTLSTIALEQFHPAVQSEAIAVARLAHLQHQSQQDSQSKRDTAVELCHSFPLEIDSWCESNSLGPVVIHLCKLERLIRFFLVDYVRNTLPILDQLGQSQDLDVLPVYPPCSQASRPQLSSTETGRLQRAFCRIELYRRLFSRCSHEVPDGIHNCLRDPPLGPAEQATLFLRDLPAFQITELGCIRDYLFRRLRGICDDLENEAVRTLPLKAMTFRRHDEAARWRSPLYVFTTQAQHQQSEHLEHLISLGLPYIKQIIESNGDKQRDLFLHYIYGSVLCHFERDFISKALEGLGRNPAFRDYVLTDRKKDFTPACDENGYSEHPQGWLWGHYHRQPYFICDRVHKGLRDWGYVFWDYDRLQDSGILRRE